MPGRLSNAWYSVGCRGLPISVVAGKGIISSVVATGVLGFATTILFLFCTPDLDTLFALEAPQPFVQIYALALGKGGSIVMTAIASLGLILVCTTSVDIIAFGLNIPLEHYRSYCGRFSPHIRRRSGRGTAVIWLDWQSRRREATSQRCHGHVRLRCRVIVHHPSQPGGLHFVDFRWRYPYYGRLRLDRATSSHNDSERFQELSFLSWSMEDAVLRFHCCVQCHCLRGE